MIDLANNEARHLAIVHRHMIKLLDRQLVPLDLGHGRYLYLFRLYNADGEKQQELADIIGADKAAATRALARLEKAGLVRRQPDKEDRRATRVYLTRKAQALRPRLEAALEESVQSFTSVLNDKERGQLKKLLAKIAAPLTPGH
jgi:DNA-binding MarR family transcriptional regulator